MVSIFHRKLWLSELGCKCILFSQIDGLEWLFKLRQIWKILYSFNKVTKHYQCRVWKFNGRKQPFGRTLRLLQYFMCANSDGSGSFGSLWNLQITWAGIKSRMSSSCGQTGLLSEVTCPIVPKKKTYIWLCPEYSLICFNWNVMKLAGIKSRMSLTSCQIGLLTLELLALLPPPPPHKIKKKKKKKKKNVFHLVHSIMKVARNKISDKFEFWQDTLELRGSVRNNWEIRLKAWNRSH